MDIKKIRFTDYGWWVGGLLGVLIGLAKADGVKNEFSTMALIGIVNGVFWGWILSMVIDRFLGSSFLRSGIKTVQQIKNQHQMAETARSNLQKFQDAKHRFKYLSDETLVTKYNDFERENKFSIQRLALEEEMVDRGILEFSKMHEKLDLQKQFFDEPEG